VGFFLKKKNLASWLNCVPMLKNKNIIPEKMLIGLICFLIAAFITY